MPPVLHIHRRTEPGQYRLVDLFPDIGTYDVLAALFADAGGFDAVLAATKVFVRVSPHDIFVDNRDGSIHIALSHLHGVSDEILYLDILHELCHVKQHRQGRDLYDRSKAYVDRETEIEAYLFTVREARRIGWNDEALSDYLRVAWITPEEHLRLARQLGVSCGAREEGGTEKSEASP